MATLATRKQNSRRLFLSEDKVYVDMPEPLPQHVINGVRFLFKQFVKQKPGVIINDPPDFDQETQLAVFLKGIHSGLDQNLKNVLILCDSNRLDIWKECLMKWLPDFDDLVAIDWPKPTSKRCIYVTSTDRLESYCRRGWGLAVVCDDSFLQYRLPPGQFKVHFKIYVTTEDLAENLHKFSQIHKWLRPDVKLDVDQFKPDKRSIISVLEKRIWFSAFVQDILIRNASTTPVPMSENKYRVVNKEPEYRKTRKNKDATGTKVKRSKRKLPDENSDEDLAASNHTNVNHITDNNDSKLVVSPSKSLSKMDIETFIRDQDHLRMDESNDIQDIDDNILGTHIRENMDVTESAKCLDLSENENSTDMKLNYSEEVPLNTDDHVYSQETQVLENNDVQFKDNDSNNINANVSNDVEFEEVTKSEDLIVEVTKVDVGLKTEELDSNDAINKLESKDSEVKTEVKDSLSKWEEMALKKFKGSFLDRLF